MNGERHYQSSDVYYLFTSLTCSECVSSDHYYLRSNGHCLWEVALAIINPSYHLVITGMCELKLFIHCNILTHLYYNSKVSTTVS